MNSALEHNLELQQNGLFTNADLEANKQGRYSPAQLKRFEETRNFMQYSANKYDNKGPIISLIFGFWISCLCRGSIFCGCVRYVAEYAGEFVLPGDGGRLASCRPVYICHYPASISGFCGNGKKHGDAARRESIGRDSDH